MTIYVERETSVLYEARLFDNYALVKMLTVRGGGGVEKVSLTEFGGRFDEFWGNPELLHSNQEEVETPPDRTMRLL